LRCWKQRVYSETVEKVPKQILGRDAEKNDFTERATINDLTIRRGHEAPKKYPLIVLKGFSTVSAETVTMGSVIFIVRPRRILPLVDIFYPILISCFDPFCKSFIGGLTYYLSQNT
jgi:hypothetical protein